MRRIHFYFFCLIGVFIFPRSSPARSLRGDSIYQLHSQWITQDGEKVPIDLFRGKPAVLAMVYTSCQDTCPLLVSHMQQIEKGLKRHKLEEMRFLLFSFDSVRDTPVNLKKYAAAHGLDLKRWTLLTGSEDSVRNLAAVLNIRYKKLQNNDFSHSAVITVLDSDGVIKYQQRGLTSALTDAISAVERAH